MERLGCDVVVAGGGTSGCVVAGRLALEGGADVVVLEAGPDHGPRDAGAWPADLLDAGALVASHSWGYDSMELYAAREPIAFPRAKVIGGCSSHNGCIAAVGCAGDYDRWAEHTGDDAWRADALRPLFRRALDRLRVRHYGEDEIGPFHRACLDAADAIGIPRADDLDDLDGKVSFGVEPVNIDGGVRVNTAFAYLDPARATGRLRILDRRLCDRLAVDPTGVEVVAWRGGSELRVRASTVVLAAGTYGSPSILLRSGIGDPEALRALGVEPRHPLQGVGANLHDHPLVEVDFAGSERLQALLAEASTRGFLPEEQTVGKLRSSHAAGPYDLHVIPVAAPEHSLLAGHLLPGRLLAGRTILAAAALEPASRGRLVLRDTRPATAPVIDHGYLSDPEGHDVEVLREGVERARELAAAEPLRDLIGAELAPGSIGDLVAAIRQAHVHYFHPVGTCAMGAASDPLAVCDGKGRVHGLERIVVADCALMPIVPRANTNIPAIVVGERIADVLLS